MRARHIAAGRASRPDLGRPFRMPLSPYLPTLSALICVYLMANLAAVPGCGSWLRFLVWMILGFVEIAYGHRHSRVRREEKAAA